MLLKSRKGKTSRAGFTTLGSRILVSGLGAENVGDSGVARVPYTKIYSCAPINKNYRVEVKNGCKIAQGAKVEYLL